MRKSKRGAFLDWQGSWPAPGNSWFCGLSHTLTEFGVSMSWRHSCGFILESGQCMPSLWTFHCCFWCTLVGGLQSGSCPLWCTCIWRRRCQAKIQESSWYPYVFFHCSSSPILFNNMLARGWQEICRVSLQNWVALKSKKPSARAAHKAIWRRVERPCHVTARWSTRVSFHGMAKKVRICSLDLKASMKLLDVNSGIRSYRLAGAHGWSLLTYSFVLSSVWTHLCWFWESQRPWDSRSRKLRHCSHA